MLKVVASQNVEPAPPSPAPSPALSGVPVAGVAIDAHASIEERARRLNAAYGAETAPAVLAHALAAFPERLALVSSFGAESATLLHVAAQVDPTIPVLFIDTGKHFAQTIDYRKKLARSLGLTNVIDVKPGADNLAETDPGGDLWRSDPDACCTLRKVAPLQATLKGYDAWITGRKQFHGGARLALPVFEASGGHIKVNPLARWDRAVVEDYLATHDLPKHPLLDQGFPSVGCWPCTKPARPDEDVRAGRWRGTDKSECGIHRI